MTSKLSLPDYSDMLGGDKASYETVNEKFSTAFDNADRIRDNAYYYQDYIYYGAWYGAGNIHGKGSGSSSVRTLFFDLPLGHVATSGSCAVGGKISVRQGGAYLNLVEDGLSSCGNNQYAFNVSGTLSEARSVVHVELPVAKSAAVRGAAGVQLEGVNLEFSGSTIATQGCTDIGASEMVGPSVINKNSENLVTKLKELYHKSSTGKGSNGTDDVDTVDGLIWCAGDTIEYGAFHTAGFITTGRTDICFHIPLGHPVAASSVTVTPTKKNSTDGDLGFWVIQNGNDVLGGDGAYTTDVSITAVLEGDKDMIRITLTTPNEMTSATNNSTCAVSCSNLLLAFH